VIRPTALRQLERVEQARHFVANRTDKGGNAHKHRENARGFVVHRNQAGFRIAGSAQEIGDAGIDDRAGHNRQHACDIGHRIGRCDVGGFDGGADYDKSNQHKDNYPEQAQ
jgi:hypothetical protein